MSDLVGIFLLVLSSAENLMMRLPEGERISTTAVLIHYRRKRGVNRRPDGHHVDLVSTVQCA